MNIRDFEVPEEDRGAFAKVMAFMARADGEISLEEKQVMDDLIFAWQLDQATIEWIYTILENGGDISDMVNAFRNSKTPFILLQELVSLAQIDGSYHADEKKAVNDVAKAMKVSPGRVAAIETWVQDGIRWRNRGLELIAPEGA